MLLQGIFPPVTTPFYPDGKIYFKKIEANVDHYSKTPVAGIVALGSTGEAIMLSSQEQRDVLKSVRTVTAPEKVLIAGTGAESALETLNLTEYAAELGYDLALVRTPFYYKKQMQPANMLAFYRMVADRSPLPILIYSVPPFTSYDMPVELIATLAEHPNIVGIKESSGNVDKIREMVEKAKHIKRSATVTDTFAPVTSRMTSAAEKSAEKNDGGELVTIGGASKPSSTAVSVVGKLKTRPKEVGFQVLVGSAQTLHPSLQAGASGAVLAFADPAPTACYEIYAAWKEGDNELAKLKQERIAKAAQRIIGELGIPALKYAMDLNGYYGGPARLPLLPITADVKAEVENLMADIRN